MQIACRVILGGMFIYASQDKIVDPHAFAEAVENFQLLPALLVPWVALVLPWLELLAGVTLLLGIFRRAATLWLTLLLLGFSAGLAISALRGIDLACGCFTIGGAAESSWRLLGRDLVFLIPALVILLFGAGPGTARGEK